MRRLTSLLVAPVLAGALALVPIQPGSAKPPGTDGGKIVLETDAQYSGFDVDIDGNGVAYVGWIDYNAAHLRLLNLCVLPSGAKDCLGGIKTIDPLGPSSASGLQVLAHPSGGATLVWFHDTDASISGPFNAMIATAEVTPAGFVTPATDRAATSSFGSLKTAVYAPNGQLWVVAQDFVSAAPQRLWVYPALGTLGPYSVDAPFFVNRARLAFDGNKVILAADYYGQISKPIAYAVSTNGGSSWSAFDTVAKTWNVAAFDMATSKHGPRLIASVSNASYYPAISKWDGNSFTKAEPTGEKEACPISSHDLVTDRSGRVADFGVACEDMRLSNMPQANDSAFTDFPNLGTVAGGDPQVATTPLGTGWVVWGIQSAQGNQLMVVPVLLPALKVADSDNSFAGKVWVFGPETCLPPVNAKVDLKADAKPGWHVASKKLELGNKQVDDKIDGGDLKPDKQYVLTGTVKFVKNGTNQDKVVSVDHKFKTCSDVGS
jgi:hypothetical protein